MKRHTWLLVFLLGAGFLSAQDCDKTLSGKVIDFHDGTPLKEATIKLNNRTFFTDAEGNYYIDHLCSMDYAFTISHADCNSQIVRLNMADVNSKIFYLEHHYTDLDQVNVVTSVKKNITNSQTESILEKDQLDKYSSRSLGDALLEVSGVNSLTSGNTIVKPVIQGLHSSRIIIMNNGVRQEDQEWGEEHAPNLDINAFNTLKVIKGSGALQYGGNAIGGVVIAENKLATVMDTVFGKTQIVANSNGRGGAVNTALNMGFKKGWSAKLQGTLKCFGDSETPDYVLSNTGHREQSFSTGVGYSNFLHGFEGYYSYYSTTQGILSSSHIGNVSDLVRAINAEVPFIINDFTYEIDAPKQETQHHLMKLNFYNRFKNLGKLNIQYSFQYNNRKEYDIRRGENRGKASLDLELQSQALESSFLFDSNNNFKKRVGFQLSYQKNKPNSETGVRRLIPDYQKKNIGIYAITEFKINNAITTDVGVRYDFFNIDAKKFYIKDFWDERKYNLNFSGIILGDFDNQLLTNPNFDYHSLSASAGINYRFSSNNSLLFNTSLANRAPNPVELFSDGLHHSAAIIEVGDLRFNSEKALKFSLSAVFSNLFNSGTLTISPYLSVIKDFILLQPTRIDYTIRGAFPVWEYKQTDARLYGLDLDYGLRISESLSFQTGFSYIYGQDTDKKKPLISMPAPSIRSSLMLEKERWSIKLLNTTSFKQTRFPNNNFETTYIQDSELKSKSIDISESPKGYSLFDISGSYKFSVWNPSDFSAGLSVSNIFNTTYRDYLNRQRFYVDNIGRNFKLNINYKF